MALMRLRQAGDIVAQLKAGIAMKCTVVRDGKENEIEARDLVPGDIIVLEEGATIPADAKIIGEYSDKDGSKVSILCHPGIEEQSPIVQEADVKQSKQILERIEQAKKGKKHEDDDHDEDDGPNKGPSICSVDQSAITGESLASDKFLGDIAYYSCGVKRGRVLGVVTVSARDSFVGKTAALVSGE
jgi:H+-transporting ATPase